MFDRFTERARKSMSFARQEAFRFRHDYIGTEHMLLGLVKEGSGVAAQVLRDRGITPSRICDEVEKIVREGSHQINWGRLPFTPRAKRVLELSLEEARNLGHAYIGTEHLLLGLVREGEGVAAQVLGHLGVKLEDVRADVLELLGRSAGPSVAPPGPPSDAGRATVANPWAMADRAARDLGHSFVGTEHVLLAILEVGGPGADALAAAGVGLDVARAAVEKLRGPRGSTHPPVQRRPTLRVIEVLQTWNGDSVDSGQILLALLRIEDGLAVTVLRGRGVDLAALRADVSRRLGAK